MLRTLCYLVFAAVFAHIQYVYAADSSAPQDFGSQAFGFQEETCVPITQNICLDEHEKEVDGYRIKQCWKYQSIYRCSGPEDNACAPLEDNRGCNEISGECIKQSPTGLCNHLVKRFVCGNNNTHEKEGLKIVGSEFNIIKDEKDLEACSSEEKDKYCEIAEEQCLEGAETRNINGKDVYKECWKWDRKYQCRTNTKIDECQYLQEQNCTEKSRECIHVEDGRCEHYTVQYECKNKTISEVDCIANRFCIGEVCEMQKSVPNNNFGLAASYLGVLSQAQKDGESCGCNKELDPECRLQNIESDKCKLFKGTARKCTRVLGNAFYNCCADKGIIKNLMGCNDEEKDLYQKQKAKLCRYIGGWPGKGFNTFNRYQSHCCFNSPLAKIIQEQGRAQLNIPWGDKKNPDCRALTLAEIQKIDFSKIDFSELYGQLRDKATRDFASQNSAIKTQLESYKNNPEFAKMMKGKVEKFYAKQ